jgi:hypothetical protein
LVSQKSNLRELKKQGKMKRKNYLGYITRREKEKKTGREKKKKRKN